MNNHAAISTIKQIDQSEEPHEKRWFSPTGTFVCVTRPNVASAVVAEGWIQRKGLLFKMMRDVNLELE